MNNLASLGVAIMYSSFCGQLLSTYSLYDWFSAPYLSWLIICLVLRIEVTEL